LPDKPPYRLALGRGNWLFETIYIYVLFLAITYQDVAFPTLFIVMLKFGYSSTSELTEFIKLYIDLYSAQTIGCLMADKELIGYKLEEPSVYSSTFRIIRHNDKLYDCLGNNAGMFSKESVISILLITTI